MELDLSKFLLEDSLYSEVDINEIGFENLLSLLFYYEKLSIPIIIKTLDSYCPICAKDTTFISDESEDIDLSRILLKAGYYAGNVGNLDSLVQDLAEVSTFQRIFHCPRPGSDSTHDLIVILKIVKSKIVKIGQNPSIADLSKKDIDKYRKLNENIYSELNRAIGLASHGIGVGAFVYLRRILEKYIVFPRLLELIEEGKIDKGLITKTDFKGKIELAREKLPDFLVSNKKIHSILSKGLHELEEKECKNYFAIMRTSIEIILDEEIQKIESDKKRKLISEQLNGIE